MESNADGETASQRGRVDLDFPGTQTYGVPTGRRDGATEGDGTHPQFRW